jgi:DNA-directed RNA polymerase specialized sigma24 family protein
MTERARLARIDDITGLPEADLVSLAQAQSEAAVREIVRRYNQRLFRAARSIVRNDADAEDVVQAGTCGRLRISTDFAETPRSAPGSPVSS